MSKKSRTRLLAPAFAAFAGLLLVACGGAAEQAPPEVDAPPPAAAAAPAAAPLDSAPSPASAAADTIVADAPDASQFPPVEPTELKVDPPRDVPEELRIIWEAWQLLHQDYVDRSQLDPEAFSEQAIRGMLRVLEDPQTAYVSPEVLSGSFQDVFHGEFEGIGAHVQMNADGKLVIVSPIEGSPAEAAGIRPGDIVLEVNGESLEDLSILEAVAKIRGPKGTEVTLLIKHLIAPEPVEITLVRGRIPLTSVLLRSQPGDPFAHIRITNVYPNTVDTLRRMLSGAIKGGAKGLILDLRNNPGGTLDATVDIASEFLDGGLVLYVIDGDGRKQEWEVREGGIAKDIPMVVLANEGSASSSEILVGAFQDHNRATIIGTTTFGKGSVNILRPLSNEGGLYITIAHWYTPLGRLIQDDGLDPDIEVVDRDAREADIKQLQRAIEELERITGVEAS